MYTIETPEGRFTADTMKEAQKLARAAQREAQTRRKKQEAVDARARDEAKRNALRVYEAICGYSQSAIPVPLSWFVGEFGSETGVTVSREFDGLYRVTIGCYSLTMWQREPRAVLVSAVGPVALIVRDGDSDRESVYALGFDCEKHNSTMLESVSLHLVHVAADDLRWVTSRTIDAAAE